ncbi:MAG: Ig-like domain repeat protein [Oligoflexales bacterium]|nr:Ig-like domain repeat protein [Oligoflexales bacterium]
MLLQFTIDKKPKGILGALFGLCLLTSLSCEKYSTLSVTERQLPEPAAVLADEDGAITGEIDPNKSTYLQASGDSAVSQNSISFPPGSLAIPTQVTLQEGSSLVANDLADQLGIADNEFSAASPATVVSSAQNIDAQNPFSINLAIGTSLRLNSSDENLIVIYKVQVHAEGGVFKVGILPNSYLKIENGFAQFATTYFGSYQLAYAKNTIEEKTESASDTPIISKNEEKALPEFAFKKIVLTLNATTRAATISAELSNSEVTLKSCVAFLDTDKSSPWDYKIAASKIDSISESIVNDSAHSLYAQLVCQSKDGRSAVSAWSEKLTVPKKVTALVDTVAPTVNVGGDVSTNSIYNMTVATAADAGGIVSYSWSKMSGSGTISFGTSNAKDTTISASVSGSYVLRLTVTDSAGNSAYDELTFTWDASLPTVSIDSPSNAAYCNADNCDTVTVEGQCSEEGRDVVIDGAVSDTATCTSGEWSVEIDYSGESEGAISITADHDDLVGNDATRASITITKDTVLPSVNAGSDVLSKVQVNLNATVSDSNGIYTYAWTKQSGTGTITFGTASAKDTTVSANADEPYTLRLTATDNAGNSAYDEMMLTWDTTGPSVNVGSDLFVKQQYSMNATTSDSNGIASYTWSKQSGAGTITFGTGTAEDTTISANADAGYVLRLTVVDNAGNSSYDELNFTWDTTQPTVNIGPDLFVKTEYSMNATPSDTNGIASYTWSKQQGSGTITFGTGTAANTTITANPEGLYVLRLTVVDNAGNSNYDEVNFTLDTTAPTFPSAPTATPGRKFGETIINFDFSNAEDYESLKIFRGNTPGEHPSLATGCTITNGFLVDEVTSFEDESIHINGMLPDQVYDFVFCLRDLAGNENINIFLSNARTGSHVVFVTSDTYAGNFLTLDPPENETQHKSGLAGADNICQSIGSNITDLDGTFWKAILSDDYTSALSRIDVKNAVYNFNMDLIRDVSTIPDTEFWTTIPNPYNKFDRDESNNFVPSDTISDSAVWTGTSANGYKISNENCNNWSSTENSNIGAIGNADSYQPDWYNFNDTNNDYNTCNFQHRLYCISQELPGLSDFHGITHPTTSNPGKILLKFTLPYDLFFNKGLRIKIFRESSGTFPADDCNGSTQIDATLPNFLEVNSLLTDPNDPELKILSDNTGSPGASFNYRICLFDNNNRLITTSHYFNVQSRSD